MKPTRREFIAGAAAATAGLALARGARAQQSPNNRIGIALIGCGNRGSDLLNTFLGEREAWNLAFPAVCDVWQHNLDQAAARVTGATGREPRRFTRHQDVLAMPEVDAVIITTPDFAHCPILIDAARAGKHAFVEKPMANRIEDANGALDAVLEHGIVCQVGTQRRSNPRHQAAARLIQSGVLGTLIQCESNWNRNVPSWVRDYEHITEDQVDWEQFLSYLPPRPYDARMFRCWHLYRECALGLVNLLGSHTIDVSQWYTDDPYPVSAVGFEAHRVWTDRENADTQDILYRFPKGHVVRFHSRLGNAYRPPENEFWGSLGYFNTGTWEVNGAGAIDSPDRITEPFTVQAEVDPDQPDRGENMNHREDWIQCIREGRTNTRADIRVGHAQSVAGILGYLACATGRPHHYDPDTRSIRAE